MPPLTIAHNIMLIHERILKECYTLYPEGMTKAVKNGRRKADQKGVHNSKYLGGRITEI